VRHPPRTATLLCTADAHALSRWGGGCGVQTAVIGDLASLLGCSMGIKNEVVAFTFVALGTSLPDTFASRTAALDDPTADAAIGNVTGSNAVNVFLGLGFSFIIGAAYWASVAGGDEARWQTMLTKYYSDTVVDHYGSVSKVPVGLPYPAGSLSFSVIVFSTCAIICLSTLSLRRAKLGAELGGLFRWPTFAFFVTLWVIYVTFSTLVAYDIIKS
jgi:solute carrier family 8 (sodium/calcium exchanger)